MIENILLIQFSLIYFINFVNNEQKLLPPLQKYFKITRNLCELKISSVIVISLYPRKSHVVISSIHILEGAIVKYKHPFRFNKVITWLLLLFVNPLLITITLFRFIFLTSFWL